MKEIRRCLTEFNFPELFTQHLLWESFRAKHAFEVNGQYFDVEGVAEKRGLVAFVCRPAPNQPFPGSAERKRIGRKIENLHHEHLVVFIDREHTRQVWAVPKREEGKSKGTSEIPFFKGKGVEHLARRIQKLSFSLEESETTTLPTVVARVNQALLAERVTKKFFKEFSDQRKVFVKFLDWIEDESKRDWYCSVLLNRLMFIYFLGGKGFLPGGTGFLTNNLAKNIKDNGADTFYTHFLLPLSFFGLGEKQTKRGRFEETFKDVLYLDGGLFTVHQVERELGLNKDAVEKGVFPEKTKIPDIEFKRWFDYFDKWRWTLDEDKVENDGYISPHILGYIFEKYINQKQMGAYYTKEDITGYICRNTIIPRLFDMLAETGERGKKAVRPLPVGPHPNLLNDGRGISDGEGIDRYIYASVKQEAKLPTETDYEQEQRRKRYEGILEDFEGEKIQGIDDFITYNLDIEKLALDFVSNIQDPEVLHAFYFKGLQQITVLDPTCGSGAFLFEALIILYPLYNACLSRMRYLVGKATGDEPDVVNWGGRLHFDDLDVDGSTLVDLVQGGDAESKVLNDLRAEVERINDHPSAEYFIKKSIIVNNLFGVDIMEEAVEICKLRLFLTLIATVERDDSKDNFGVEPLPDIDFNILAGNTLVGYTSIEDIDRLWDFASISRGDATASLLATVRNHDALKRDLAEYSKLIGHFRAKQLDPTHQPGVTKEQVLRAGDLLRRPLDLDLFDLYAKVGLIPGSTGSAHGADVRFPKWKRNHEPFHWLLEFPSIEAAGGFDVIVGNPPYVEYSKKKAGTSIKDAYKIVGYVSEAADNLFAFCVERVQELVSPSGRNSMIVPVSLTAGARTESLRPLLLSGSLWMCSFSNRPGKLFDGVEQRLTIYIRVPNGKVASYDAGMRHWYGEERNTLFESLAYTASWAKDGLPAKLDSSFTDSVLKKLLKAHSKSWALSRQGAHKVWFHDAPTYWVRAMSFDPNSSTEPSSHYKVLSFEREEDARIAACLLNSTFYYIFFKAFSNCRDMLMSDVTAYPFPSLDAEAERKMLLVGARIMSALKQSATLKTRQYPSGEIEYEEYYPIRASREIGELDELLAEHYGLSVEERLHVEMYLRKYRGSTEEDSEA